MERFSIVKSTYLNQETRVPGGKDRCEGGPQEAREALLRGELPSAFESVAADLRRDKAAPISWCDLKSKGTKMPIVVF